MKKTTWSKNEIKSLIQALQNQKYAHLEDAKKTNDLNEYEILDIQVNLIDEILSIFTAEGYQFYKDMIDNEK